METREPNIRPKVGVGVMIVFGNKVLLGKRKGAHGDGHYGWPGGHLEYGETLEECGKREVFEETGITIKEINLLCMNNIIEYNKHYLDFEFIAELDAEIYAEIKEPEFVDKWKWYDLDDLPSPLFKPVELALKAIADKTFYPNIYKNNAENN